VIQEVEIGFGDVFEKTISAFESGKKIVIHKGGTGSGKTEDIMIYLIFNVALVHKNKIITVVSESRPHLDIGVIRIAKKHLRNAGIFSSKDFNETQGRYVFPKTGSILEFFSADRIDKALGARRDWLFGNEINSLKEEVWDELARRSENVIGDFNPTTQFWLENWIENYDNTEIITSNYLNNPFLPETERERIIKRSSKDENFHRVHVLCEYGGAEGLILSNFRYEIDSEVERAFIENPYGYGLDYGFNPDPDAMVKVAIDNRRKIIYAKEMIYRQNNGTDDLITQIKAFAKPHELIVAESASPRTNFDLRKHFNIVSVSKTKTVAEWLRFMQDYEIVITQDSTNLIKELRNYIWSDKKSGTPIDLFNHLIDALRYYLMNTNQRNYF
jgi:phage terminase large subunit